jgi:hypothetical protein
MGVELTDLTSKLENLENSIGVLEASLEQQKFEEEEARKKNKGKAE